MAGSGEIGGGGPPPPAGGRGAPGPRPLLAAPPGPSKDRPPRAVLSPPRARLAAPARPPRRGPPPRPLPSPSPQWGLPRPRRPAAGRAAGGGGRGERAANSPPHQAPQADSRGSVLAKATSTLITSLTS